jgi:hypothetical protein
MASPRHSQGQAFAHHDGDAKPEKITMAKAADQAISEFQRGWDAALLAARSWHEGKASQAMVQSRRTRFPKNLEREAEVHKRSAELIVNLSPDDV